MGDAVPTVWQFGPFARGLSAVERVARLRTLRAVVMMHCGPRVDVVARALDLAEASPDAEQLAIGALERLPSLDRRRELATYRRVSEAPPTARVS
ncbi:hypothetical protein MKK69_04540 [Methylobacterium sp. J-026]|uniref:hypothetical protein n=1 Tax=Methylobacterium sp. J-026 TaxID=2836624 RepID=UPI001FB891AB|nr:hypothetical protein [Methylobacterium sp. J-026]MCJ2133336.1 hypothetical protein [Methylobacterium sp. J-026]